MQDSDPTPQNTDEGKDQETTSFSQEQVNDIVSKRCRIISQPLQHKTIE